MVEFNNMSEIHTHLGSLIEDKNILWDMSKAQGIKTGCSSFDEFCSMFDVPEEEDYEKYLKKYVMTQNIQSSPLAIEQSVYQGMSNAYRNHGITTIDIRFNPMLRNHANYFNLDDLILHAHIGLIKATNSYPIKGGLIISTDRSFDTKRSWILSRKAVNFYEKGMVHGFDISGSSPNFDPRIHLGAFRHAKMNGMGITCHMAEGNTDDMEDVDYMIHNYGVDRIGHGTKIFADNNQNLIEFIRDTGIVIELCPISNIHTKLHTKDDLVNIINSIQANGINFSLNSDGPLFLSTSIREQYEQFGNHIESVYEHIKMSHNFAFCNHYRSKNTLK